MPLYVDGVQINSVYVDGIQQTSFYVDGVNVLSSFPTVGWSGNTTISGFWFGYGTVTQGLNVSGVTFRQHSQLDSTTKYGQWMTVNSDSTMTPTGVSQAQVGNSNVDFGFETSGTSIRHYRIQTSTTYYGAWATMEGANGFSVDSIYGNCGWQVSGATQRAAVSEFTQELPNYGPWITIT